MSWKDIVRTQGPLRLRSPHVSAGDKDGYALSWTWDTPLGGTLAKGTPTEGLPGPPGTPGTTRSPGHPSPAPRACGDTGEACEGVRGGLERGTPPFPVVTQLSPQKDPTLIHPHTRGCCLCQGTSPGAAGKMSDGIPGCQDWEQGSSWHLVGRGQGCCYRSCNTQDPPQQNPTQPQRAAVRG